jgi:hypothetical protein
MPSRSLTISRFAAVLVASCLTFGAIIAANGQSQEPKPKPGGLPATPVAPRDDEGVATPVTGVSDSSWEGPNWGVRASWDPTLWSVEGELIDSGYDGLQIGTPASTVFIEAYDGFAGDAEDCLANAEREIGERDGIAELVTLSGRTMPATGANSGPARLFGLVATPPGGEPLRGTEYVECRALVPGRAVIEITWQTLSASYNDELPLVDALLGTIEVAGSSEPPLLPSAPPLAEPDTAQSWTSPPESASAK